MSRLASDIERACADLDLRADLGFRLALSGQNIETIARIADVGAPNGMLVVSSYDVVRNHTDELLEAGYGFSVLDEPHPSEEYDVESFKVMFLFQSYVSRLGVGGRISQEPKLDVMTYIRSTDGSRDWHYEEANAASLRTVAASVCASVHRCRPDSELLLRDHAAN